MTGDELMQQQQQQHKLYYQYNNLQYNTLIQKKVTFTQNN